MLITPHYKTRQKLVSIITNAPLVSDPMWEETLCDPDICGRLCAAVCPTNAIPVDTAQNVSCVIGGKEVIYGKLEGWRWLKGIRIYYVAEKLGMVIFSLQR
jgi:hypothetical protein